MNSDALIALSAKEAADRLRISERTFHALRGRPDFPKPRGLANGGRCLRWSASELREWFDKQAGVPKSTEPPQLAARRYKSGSLVTRRGD